VLAALVLGVRSEVRRLQAWAERRAGSRAYYEGDVDAALAHYDTVRRLLPGLPSSYTDPADSLCEVLQWAPEHFESRDTFDAAVVAATAHYVDAIRVSTPNAWAYAGLASLAEILGESRRRALTMDLAVFQRDPLDSLGPEDRLQEAALLRAVLLEPHNYYYRDFLGYFYWKRGFWERAKAQVRQAIALQPSLDRHFYLANLLSVSPELLEAVELGVNDALRSPDTLVPASQIHRLLAEVYLGSGRLRQARESFAAAAQEGHVPFAMHVQIGRTHVAEGHDEMALASFRTATELDTSYAPAWTQLGLTLSRLERHDEAVDALRHARGLSPTAYRPAWMLALELQQGNRTDEALPIFEGLERRFPDKREPALRLIDLYLELGRQDRAVDVARRLTERFPDEEVLRDQLEQLETLRDRPR